VTGPVYVVACSKAKGDRPAPAAVLYTGRMFRHTYAAAAATGHTVLILSARYGLAGPGAWLAPYDLRITDPGSVTAGHLAVQAHALGLAGREARCLLPRAYWQRLRPALAQVGALPVDLYAGCRGIGEQRAVNRAVAGVPRGPW
jgi:hypothetical protein